MWWLKLNAGSLFFFSFSLFSLRVRKSTYNVEFVKFLQFFTNLLSFLKLTGNFKQKNLQFNALYLRFRYNFINFLNFSTFYVVTSPASMLTSFADNEAAILLLYVDVFLSFSFFLTSCEIVSVANINDAYGAVNCCCSLFTY